MKALILEAGYGTRMYPLTENIPKGLLPVGGKPILDYLIRKVGAVRKIDKIYVVTNHKFYDTFAKWHSKLRSAKKKIALINDGTLTNETRLGSIRDIQLAITEKGIKDDLMVMGGDNIYDLSFSDFANYFFGKKKGNVVAVHRVTDIERLRRTGVILMDDDTRLTLFQEKPAEPVSDLAVPPLYIFRKDTLPMVAGYIHEGNDADAPGNLIAWLLEQRPVYGYMFKGMCYDIGDIEGYERLKDGLPKK